MPWVNTSSTDAATNAAPAARRAGRRSAGSPSRSWSKPSEPAAPCGVRPRALRWMVARERQDIPTLLMRFAPELNLDEVADPYGGPAAGYDAALDLIEAGCHGLFEGFRSELKAARSG